MAMDYSVNESVMIVLCEAFGLLTGGRNEGNTIVTDTCLKTSANTEMDLLLNDLPLQGKCQIK